ncbi:hypothetical protein [Microvirga antarctica]|uniref:hypothetical protein n=1 Tax=Microvirga antarctica TaxID=2819233 RepID=UPI001B316513|nr:hypothetical protein [Microvirga antarctica]
MRIIMTISAIGAVALSLAGCQTAEQSLASAQAVCMDAGLRPGTTAYGRCTNATYQQNVANSNATANAVAVGAAAGIIGGAVIAAESRPYYGGYYRPYGYYRGYCNRWGCY